MVGYSYNIVNEWVDEHRGNFLALGNRRVEMGRIHMSAHQSNNLGVSLNVLKTVFPNRNVDYRKSGIGTALLLTGVKWAESIGRTYLTGLYAPDIPWDEDDERWLNKRGITMLNGGEIHGIVYLIIAACEMIQREQTQF